MATAYLYNLSTGETTNWYCQSRPQTGDLIDLYPHGCARVEGAVHTSTDHTYYVVLPIPDINNYTDVWDHFRPVKVT